MRFNDGPQSEARKLAAELEADATFSRELARIRDLDMAQIKKDLAELLAHDSAPAPPKEQPKQEFFHFSPPPGPPPPPGVAKRDVVDRNEGEGRKKQPKEEKGSDDETFFEEQERQLKAKIAAQIAEEGEKDAQGLKAALEASEQSGGVGLKWLGATSGK